jgi:hypothetical protein
MGWLNSRARITRSASISLPGFSETKYCSGPGSDCNRFM